MKNILCFGDSNTFGTNPEGGRHGREVRWPGRLQKLLGDDWYVIEEGMGGRTTVWDDPLEPNRRGIAALPIALTSHRPLDLVIISLGTNDCKAFFHASPKVIARGAEALCKLVLNFTMARGRRYPGFCWYLQFILEIGSRRLLTSVLTVSRLRNPAAWDHYMKR